MYWLRNPKFIKKLYSAAIWENPIKEREPSVYLSFDDGPHPIITTFVLDLLAEYNAKATFFFIGKNVVAHPQILSRVIHEGHRVGNHSHQHLNGWKTKNELYIEDILRAEQFIPSKLFRPPYGRINKMQAFCLKDLGFQLVMWSLLSGDFDQSISPQRCLENVILHMKPNDIIVFHDSEKARKNLEYVLPLVLKHCQQQGWQMNALPENFE